MILRMDLRFQLGIPGRGQSDQQIPNTCVRFGDRQKPVDGFIECRAVLAFPAETEIQRKDGGGLRPGSMQLPRQVEPIG
jgi:hypothetical protein